MLHACLLLTLDAPLGQAQAVLREAHSRGVELEGVREVRVCLWTEDGVCGASIGTFQRRWIHWIVIRVFIIVNYCQINELSIFPPGQTWCRLVQDYQCLHHHLEAVEGTIPTVGLVEETEERLNDRISLYQVPLCCYAEFDPRTTTQ